jgi:RNA polymerase sigma factor (sigma-70 family)
MPPPIDPEKKADVVLTPEQQQMVLDNLPLIYFAIRRYRSTIPETAFEDLTSRLYWRLCRCAAIYKPEMGLKPSSYFMKSLQGEAANYFRDEIWMIKPPRTTRERSFTETLGERVLEGESDNLEMLRSCVSPLSLDGPVGEDGDIWLDVVADDISVEDLVVNKIGGDQIVREVFRALALEERFVLALQMDQRPLSELQERFQVSRPTAQRIWDELQAKARDLYLTARDGEPCTPSKGSVTLRRLLVKRFVAPKIGAELRRQELANRQ